MQGALHLDEVTAAQVIGYNYLWKYTAPVKKGVRYRVNLVDSDYKNCLFHIFLSHMITPLLKIIAQYPYSQY